MVFAGALLDFPGISFIFTRIRSVYAPVVLAGGLYAESSLFYFSINSSSVVFFGCGITLLLVHALWNSHNGFFPKTKNNGAAPARTQSEVRWKRGRG